MGFVKFSPSCFLLSESSRIWVVCLEKRIHHLFPFPYALTNNTHERIDRSLLELLYFSSEIRRYDRKALRCAVVRTADGIIACCLGAVLNNICIHCGATAWLVLQWLLSRTNHYWGGANKQSRELGINVSCILTRYTKCTSWTCWVGSFYYDFLDLMTSIGSIKSTQFTINSILSLRNIQALS